MVALKALFILCTLGGQAWGAASPPAVCSTKLGTVSIAQNRIPTATATVAEKITMIKKFIRKVNVVVIPKPKTTTILTTSLVTSTKTADANIRTATDTVESKITVVSTLTSIATTTSQSTTIATKFVTEVVPTPPGFTPVLEDPLYEARRKARRGEKKDGDVPGAAGPLYPQRVDCVQKKPFTSTKSITTTVQGARVTLKAITRTRMSTIVQTVTSTEFPPDVDTTTVTTIYPTTTSWVGTTSTITIVEIVTIESQVPGATTYDVCKDSNILLTANNGGRVVAWAGVSKVDNVPTGVGVVSTPAECCVECAKRPYCRISLFDTTDNNCYVYLTGNSNMCANNQQPTFAMGHVANSETAGA
ncbi:hypothetical protein FSARC_4065 [Fusarium sarcochroum]|uniref:Apple domain-containing protein n=1 Tax=Fusarium sarcochroum TaxID=1208366 RepID=A0A8H4U2A6_9HYPO|nr:hypothetical protein FSARC_4065 [Fusarium sarcochroum]